MVGVSQSLLVRVYSCHTSSFFKFKVWQVWQFYYSAFYNLLDRILPSNLWFILQLPVEMMKKLHSEASPSCPWVFPARNGGHIKDARKALWKAMKQAGISDLRPHDLRRSFASLLVNANVDIYQIKDLLGHSSVSVTQKSYAYLQESTLRSASEVMVKTLEDALGKMVIPVLVQP